MNKEIEEIIVTASIKVIQKNRKEWIANWRKLVPLLLDRGDSIDQIIKQVKEAK
jgi:hypothetical protein